MLIKLGLKEFKKSIFMNILIIFQMAIIFAIAISITSSVVSRYKFYAPFSDYIEGNGLAWFSSSPRTDDNLLPLTYKDGEFTKNLKGVKRFTASYIMIPFQGEIHSLLMYDKDLLERYTPELESGEWLDSADKYKGEYLPVVISANGGKYKVGDTIDIDSPLADLEKTRKRDFTDIDKREPVRCEIIGIIKDNTPVFGFSDKLTRAAEAPIVSRDLFGAYSYEFEQKILVISSIESILKFNSGRQFQIMPMMDGPVLIEFDSNLTEEEKENNEKILVKMGTQKIIPLSEMKENSLDHIYEQVKNLIPIILTIFLIVIVSAVSVNTISTKRQFRNFAVYYICGLKWRDCSKINLISSIFTMLLSGILSLFVLQILDKLTLFENTVMSFGIWQVLICVAIAIVYCLLSLFLPTLLIRNTSAREILKEN
jgi:hypothetical protein